MTRAIQLIVMLQSFMGITLNCDDGRKEITGVTLYAEYLNSIPSQINMESENLFNSAHNPAFQAYLDAVWMGG